MNSIIKSIVAFILGWILLFLFSAISWRTGGVDNFQAIMYLILYLSSVITYFCSKILEKLDKDSKK